MCEATRTASDGSVHVLDQNRVEEGDFVGGGDLPTARTEMSEMAPTTSGGTNALQSCDKEPARQHYRRQPHAQPHTTACMQERVHKVCVYRGEVASAGLGVGAGGGPRHGFAHHEVLVPAIAAIRCTHARSRTTKTDIRCTIPNTSRSAAAQSWHHHARAIAAGMACRLSNGGGVRTAVGVQLEEGGRRAEPAGARGDEASGRASEAKVSNSGPETRTIRSQQQRGRRTR